MTKAEINLLRPRILETMRLIRSVPRPLVSGPHDRAKGSEVWTGNLHGQPADRLIIYLRSSGCSWAMDGSVAKKFRAGCLDCEHSVADTTYGEPISVADYFTQFRREFEAHDSRRYPILCLYNEGSFFNERELPAEARRHILRHIAANGFVKRLVIESLPEYLTEAVLIETNQLLRGIELEIGVGLESSDETVRALCINKPYTLKSFERTSQMVRRHGRLLAYVLLKPSFLTEREAIDDTVRTVRYAFDLGVDSVSIEPISIGRFTMSGVLHHLKLYKPAWLRSVLACAKAAAPLGEVRIGGYQFSPTYLYHAVNCRICTEAVKKDIQNFNQTYDRTLLEKQYVCCARTWESELSTRYPSLVERIPIQLDQIGSFLSKHDLHSILGAD